MPNFPPPRTYRSTGISKFRIAPKLLVSSFPRK
ncbi:MAG TPA: hypothetical protein DCS15_00295 [Flavobacteriales bacterium]|nr:hypothetical protein [Flavobacteriales bacterium]